MWRGLPWPYSFQFQSQMVSLHKVHLQSKPGHESKRSKLLCWKWGSKWQNAGICRRLPKVTLLELLLCQIQAGVCGMIWVRMQIQACKKVSWINSIAKHMRPSTEIEVLKSSLCFYLVPFECVFHKITASQVWLPCWQQRHISIC